MKSMKDTVLEIASIAQECPERFQQICFEVLLKHSLGEHGGAPPSPLQKPKVQDREPEPENVVEKTALTQQDLSSTDLHLKVRRFVQKHDLSVDHLNQLFYKENDAILPLYDDLRTTKTSESQVRIALLQCLLNAIRSGDFETTVQRVREEAVTRKCYDSNNWRNNFTNNAALFDFDKYTKDVTTIGLSDQGRKTLAELVKELQ
jgi:hypothetical protein